MVEQYVRGRFDLTAAGPSREPPVARLAGPRSKFEPPAGVPLGQQHACDSEQYPPAASRRPGPSKRDRAPVSEQPKIIESSAMPPIPDKAAFQNSLANLPLVTYQPGETVIANGSRTGRLLILREGTVAIVKEDTEIARVAEPGAVFGELSVLLDRPHTSDVRALESSEFHVADATTLFAHPIAVLHVATILAHRLDRANHALIELKNQLLTGEPHGVVVRTVSKMERLLSIGWATGRPSDEFIDD
jgi:CRP/FNR family cyclic AMP-dependent transcriptional regulator